MTKFYLVKEPKLLGDDWKDGKILGRGHAVQAKVNDDNARLTVAEINFENLKIAQQLTGDYHYESKELDEISEDMAKAIAGLPKAIEKLKKIAEWESLQHHPVGRYAREALEEMGFEFEMDVSEL